MPLNYVGGVEIKFHTFLPATEIEAGGQVHAPNISSLVE